MMDRWITVGRLMREFGLPWPQAEAIIREQTARARRKPWVEAWYLGSFLMCVAGVPWLVGPQHRALGLVLRLVFLLAMLAGVLLPRVVAHQAILDAAAAPRPSGSAPTDASPAGRPPRR